MSPRSLRDRAEARRDLATEDEALAMRKLDEAGVETNPDRRRCLEGRAAIARADAANHRAAADAYERMAEGGEA